MICSPQLIIIAIAMVMRYSRDIRCALCLQFRGVLEMFFLHFLGIVPIFCEQVFVGISEKKQAGDSGQYEVIF